MSFAQDIVNKISPTKNVRKPKKKRIYYTGHHPFRNTEKLSNGMFLARIRNKGKCVNLCTFTDRTRAGLSSRLYRLWMNRGYDDVPNGSGHGTSYTECVNTKVKDSTLSNIMDVYGPETDIYHIARELREMRVLIYGKAKAFNI